MNKQAAHKAKAVPLTTPFQGRARCTGAGHQGSRGEFEEGGAGCCAGSGDRGWGRRRTGHHPEPHRRQSRRYVCVQAMLIKHLHVSDAHMMHTYILYMIYYKASACV